MIFGHRAVSLNNQIIRMEIIKPFLFKLIINTFSFRLDYTQIERIAFFQ